MIRQAAPFGRAVSGTLHVPSARVLDEVMAGKALRRQVLDDPERVGRGDPLTAAVADAPLHMFVLYDDRLVAIEVETGMIMLRDPVDIAHYAELFDFYRRHALRGEAAREFVLAVAEDYRGDARDRPP
ncbi:MAG: hypothetical protein ACRDRH_01545 [Pseudonocardia sp.]